MTISVTPRQADLLRFVAGHQQAKGWTPSYSQIARALGVASPSNVARLVAGLERRGYIWRAPGLAQSLDICVHVTLPRAPDGAPLWSVPLPAERRA